MAAWCDRCGNFYDSSAWPQKALCARCDLAPHFVFVPPSEVPRARRENGLNGS